MVVRTFSVVTLLCWIAGSTGPAAAGGGTLAQRLHGRVLTSGYLAEPALGARQITLQGSESAFTVTLDPNTCGLDAFGDPQTCTRMAPQRVSCRVLRFRAADPTGQDRLLIGLEATTPLPSTMLLVVPQVGREGFRLLVKGPASRQPRVIALHAVVRPRKTPTPVPDSGEVAPPSPTPPGKPDPNDRRTPCRVQATYVATQQGDLLTIVAQGQAPTPGYEFQLRPHRAASNPPRWQLSCQPPTGTVAQVVVPFEVRDTYRVGRALTQIIVVDGYGEHRVFVARR